ncbi:hypothetical protein D3C76_1381950 [compost metagenome]
MGHQLVAGIGSGNNHRFLRAIQAVVSFTTPEAVQVVLQGWRTELTAHHERSQLKVLARVEALPLSLLGQCQ